MRAEELSAALASFRSALGDDAVITAPAQVARYGRGDYRDAPSPVAVVRPSSRDDVVAAVRTAASHRIALYPISRGQNWGYGASCPVGADQVILDLGRLDRVLHVDTELAYAVLEPGVTQRQLYDHLEANGGHLLLDCTDAPDATSFVGNCLDRGLGFSPMGARALNVCGMEIVLADGSIVDTGFGGLGETSLAHTRRFGLGPSLEGLFSQSNLGIVTKIGVWLAPKPEVVSSFWIAVEGDVAFSRVLERLRDVMLHAGITTVVHAGNWLGEAGWVVQGGLHGTRAYVDYAYATLEKTFAADGITVDFVDAAETLERAGASLALRLSAPLRPVSEHIHRFVGIYAGRPLEHALFPSGHLAVDEDREAPFRHVTVNASCNVRTSDICEMFATARREMAARSQQVRLWAAMHDARTVTAILHMIYPKDNLEAEARALACHDALFEEVFRRGYFPYRAGNRIMHRLDANRTAYWATVRRLKAALDPDGVLAPGKYLPDAT